MLLRFQRHRLTFTPTVPTPTIRLRNIIELSFRRFIRLGNDYQITLVAAIYLDLVINPTDSINGQNGGLGDLLQEISGHLPLNRHASNFANQV